MVLPIIGAVAGGLISSIGASKAADAQKDASAAQLALESQIYNETTQRFKPFLNSGKNALAALNFELGLGPRPVFGQRIKPLDIREINDTTRTANPSYNPVNPYWTTSTDRWEGDSGRGNYPGGQPGDAQPRYITTETTKYKVGDEVFNDKAKAQAYAQKYGTKVGGRKYEGFQETPGYAFALNEGIKGIDASAASRGNVFSGATMKDAQRFGTGLANQTYDRYVNRLAEQAGMGQAAAGQTATAGANYGSGAGSSYANMGNAGAAGWIGGTNAINTGIQNALSAWQYQQLAQPNSGGIVPPSSSLMRQVQGVL